MASQATAQSKKRLALAVIDFLQKSSTDGTIDAEDAEQLEVAQSCIAEAFKVDAADEAAMKDAVGGQSLLDIYGVYEKLKGKGAAASSSTSTPSSSKAAASEDDKAEAEKLKGLGNDAMKKKDYNAAIEYYSKALDLVPLHPIYLSNRAAAYSGLSKHEEAKSDAEMAVAADPKYSKAWSRLGLARYVTGDAKGAMEAYQSGMEAEGNGGSDVMRKGYETAKRTYEREASMRANASDAEEAPRGGAGGAGGMPDLSSLAGLMGGGGGGMPDFSSMMQNPMIRQMAENIMSNPDTLSNLMNNPQLAAAAERFRGGATSGGTPDIASLMNDPSIAEMARNFAGGFGGAGGAGGAGRGAGN